MLYSVYTTLIIIETALTLNLLIINSVSKNRRKTNTNTPLLQNFKDNQVKYSKDELLDIRKKQ